MTLIVPETIGDLIVASARRHAALPAVSDASRSLTYAELADWGSRLSNVLAGRGLRVGTRVALLVEDEALSLPAYLGTWLAGCTAVHVNARLAVPEIDYILDDSEVDALLYSPGFGNVVEQLARGKDLSFLRGTRPHDHVGGGGVSSPPRAAPRRIVRDNARTMSSTVHEDDASARSSLTCRSHRIRGRPNSRHSGRSSGRSARWRISRCARWPG